MKIIRHLSYIILSLIIVIASCKKSNPPFIPSKSYFTNSVGDKFTYSVTDSINNKTFNVNVSIIGKTTMLNGLPVSIWTYTSPNGVDTNYVFSNKDSVVFYSNRKLDNTTAITNSYHFPLTIGAKWQVSFQDDTSTVIGNSNISVNNKTYNNAFLIREKGHANNYSIMKDQWFVPNIGMIKMYVKQTTFGNSQVQTWVLSGYDVF